MTTPPEQLEHSLELHGDTLYRVALVVAGDEARAAHLLRELASGIRAERGAPAAPVAALDEPGLLARLVAAGRAQAERAPRGGGAGQRRRRPAIRAPMFAPFALYNLPLEQRVALALHLLLGYDGARIAGVLGGATPAARAALVSAVRALGPAAGATLTDRVSGELCDGVREVLADPAAGSRHAAVVRGHLAGCAPCRAFDQAWAAILTPVEAALRGALRDRTLPAALRTKLIAQATPRGKGAARRLRISRLALAPAGVLALILAIVLPGFLREPVSVVERQASPPVDAQALIAQSLRRHTAAPPSRSGVWHGRYETLWFFNDDVYAPIRADIWLDPREPARHRLQLAHRDGGAPYELQIGDGVRRLAYALDAAYAPSLYGGLTTEARVDEPALISQPLDRAGQLQARDERLRSGPWSLPPAYLLQAQRASDLRLLGRQRDNGRIVQILSFSGVSPLGLPPDAPGATAERVTVLLALDSEDGLLRSATELAGPAGSAQTGRVTWRLVEEQWLSGLDQIQEAFDSERAWTGIGDFSEAAYATSADLAVPLVEARAVGDPAALLGLGGLPTWIPARPPPGVDRALLVWEGGDRRMGAPPRGLIYLGAGRRLVLAYNRVQALEGETMTLGPWRVTLRPGRGQRYTASLARADGLPDLTNWGLFDTSANLALDATGFTRAELEALIAALAPFDLGALVDLDALFVRPDGDSADAAARAALLAAAYATVRLPADRAWHLTSRWYARQDPAPAGARRDPYHLPPYEGRPEVIAAEEWLAGQGVGQAYYRRSSDPAGGAEVAGFYIGGGQIWRYLPGVDALELGPAIQVPLSARLPRVGALALDLLARPGQLALEPLPGGGRVVRHSEPARSSPRYSQSLLSLSPAEPHLFDLRPLTMTTELELSPADEVMAARVYAEGRDDARRTRTLVESYEVVAREMVSLDAAPARLREGTPPPAQIVREYTFEPRVPVRVQRSSDLGQALSWPGAPLYVPAEGAATLLFLEEGVVATQGPSIDYSVFGSDPLREAVARRLAVQLTYSAPSGPSGASPLEVRLTQGPAVDLGALLRSTPHLLWDASEPIRLTVAGREVQAWYGYGSRSYLIVELGETLLIADSDRPLTDPELQALLAGLRPVR